MLTLAAADTIAGVAGTATTVTVTISGLEITSAGVETYKVLYQGQLAAAAATLYTVPASTTAMVRSISVVNTSASATQTFQLFRGGLVGANAITPLLALPISGSAHSDGRSWDILPTSTGPWVTTIPTASQLITAQSATVIPLTLREHASQSVDVFVVEDSAGTDLVKVDSTGRVGIGVTPGDANASLELAKGIRFPATEVASTDANTLDDYEEGTFTPSLTFANPGTLNVIYVSRTGRYTKVGNLCTVRVLISTSTFTLGTATGLLRVSGLPFSTGASVGFPLMAASMSGYTKAGYTQVAAELAASISHLVIYATGSAVAGTELAAGDTPTGGQVVIFISGQYET